MAEAVHDPRLRLRDQVRAHRNAKAPVCLTQSLTDNCDAARFCPQQAVDKTQFAVLILKAVNGLGYAPPPAASSPFTDVDIGVAGVAGDGDFGADWVIEAVNRGYLAGCTTDRYCAKQVVTRRAAAETLSRAFGLAPLL